MSFSKWRTLLLPLVLLICSHAFAVSYIARSGACSASGTSCTASATKTGDLKIVFAYRSASTTAPTLPSGWTNIANGSEGTSGTTAAYRVGCKAASSSSDTSSGAWTNATLVVQVSYSGTLVGAAATCSTVAIGGKVFTGAQTSASLTYTTISMTHTDGTSWVVGFAGNSAGGLCTPSGMSSVSSVGTGPAGIVNDTNASATSWATKSCTVTSGTWVSYVLEILGTPSGFTHIQGAENSNFSTNVTTLSVTLGATPTQGDLICVAMMAASSGGTISGLSIKDGNNNAYTISPHSPSGGVYSAYLIAPSNATAVITSTWTTATEVDLYAEEFGASGGTISFGNDVAGTGTGTAVNTPTVTPAASHELAYALTASGVSGSNVSAPAAGAAAGVWTGGAAGVPEGDGTEYDLDISSGNAVNFTQTTGTWFSMGMTFINSLNVTAIPRMTLLGVGP